MKGFTAGLVMGVTFGMAATAFAIPGFYDTAEIFKLTRSQQSVYVAGATDMLQAAASSAREKAGVAWLSRQASCMAEKGFLGARTDWAVVKWTEVLAEGAGSKYQAASVLLDQACD